MNEEKHPQEEMYNSISRILTEKDYFKAGTIHASDTLEYELWIEPKNKSVYVLLELQLGESREIQFVRVYRETTPSMGAEYNPVNVLLELLDSK